MLTTARRTALTARRYCGGRTEPRCGDRPDWGRDGDWARCGESRCDEWRWSAVHLPRPGHVYDQTVLRALQETDDAFKAHGAASCTLELRLLESAANLIRWSLLDTGRVRARYREETSEARTKEALIDPNSVTPSMPAKTAIPMAWRISPAPLANTSGTTPAMKASEVIRMGRSRSRQASMTASSALDPSASRPADFKLVDA